MCEWLYTMHDMNNIKVFLHHSTEAGCEPSRPPAQLLLGMRPGPDADRSLCALLRIKARDVYLCLPTRLPGLEINRRDIIACYLGSENKQRLLPRRASSVDHLMRILWGRNWIFILMSLISRCTTVSWLRRLVDGLPPRWPRFDPSPLQVSFVVDIVALREGFCRVLRLSPVSITLPMLPLLLRL